jgi:hypothetical protein
MHANLGFMLLAASAQKGLCPIAVPSRRQIDGLSLNRACDADVRLAGFRGPLGGPRLSIPVRRLSKSQRI